MAGEASHRLVPSALNYSKMFIEAKHRQKPVIKNCGSAYPELVKVTKEICHCYIPETIKRAFATFAVEHWRGGFPASGISLRPPVVSAVFIDHVPDRVRQEIIGEGVATLPEWHTRRRAAPMRKIDHIDSIAREIEPEGLEHFRD